MQQRPDRSTAWCLAARRQPPDELGRLEDERGDPRHSPRQSGSGLCSAPSLGREKYPENMCQRPYERHWFLKLRSISLATSCPVSVSTMEPQTMIRSEEHTSELQSLMRISYAVFCLKKKNKKKKTKVIPIN